MTEPFQDLLQRCVSLDLEVDPATATIFAFAAVRDDTRPPILAGKRDLVAALDRLEAQATGVGHVLGHNILRHDLPHLAATRLGLAKLFQSPIDTLWLNPLAFPRNPYHHLVKHYQDGRLQAGHVNDPERDARLVFQVLRNQLAAFSEQNAAQPDALAAFHFLTTRMENPDGFDAVFRAVRRAGAPDAPAARDAIVRLLAVRACDLRLEQTLDRLASPQLGWPMAYALSWILVAGGDSVMPPWVRAQFREASLIVRHLRDTNCDNSGCAWCTERNDPVRALSRWFGFPAFRAEPVDDEGRPLQERIVEEAMRGASVLGILPTGTGKSVCYQVPALSRFDKTGALTVVISPLVALMADQVQGMERAGIASSVTVNGMLSMPERQDALDRVRLGEAAMLLISPEQLRSNSVRSVLAQREIGLWVLDEAHCVSKWGHDFRPDYRYVSRFIKETAGDEQAPPLLCLTATARPEVVRDISDHFRSRLDRELILLDGGATRGNLRFEVRATQRATKLVDILDVIEARLPKEGASGAVVYCATRGETERVAEFLRQQGLAADRFHAGLTSEEKRGIQEAFRTGELRVIAATNAFGMGIDKPDIRLVVHGDIPGSLENYLQEAGRAGRDRASADCVLLFCADDVERQFALSARSRLARHEIGAILKALRRLDERMKKSGPVVATPGEVVKAEQERDFERDSATDDTRVKTAVSWLEEAKLLSREENRVQVFPSSLRIRTLDEAEAMLARAAITGTHRSQLIDITRHLMNAPPDQGISTDELAGASGLTGRLLLKALADLETLGIARNDVAVTVFVHAAVEGHSQQRLAQAAALETALIAAMRELAPDAEGAGHIPLHLAETCQVLRNQGHGAVSPDVVEKLLRGMGRDGRDQDGGKGNLRLRKASRNTLAVSLQRSWQALEQTAGLRRQGAELLLSHLLGRLPKGSRGKDIQVETTIGDLLAALNGDALLRGSGIQDMTKLMDRALLWLHEQGVVTLGKGLTVFRQAMTIHLNPTGGQFTTKDFVPLEEHYAEQTVQTHVMAAYAERGLAAMDQALRLSEDYFVLARDAFLRRWLPGRGAELRRQTTGASWKKIVEVLDNPVQQKIVADDREQTSVLVLAGPGSGKTRVLVHRIAYLIRVRREDPRGILVLTYNRHAAAEIRIRLRHLIGEAANAVTISTCHALAMRLVGASFAGVASETKHDFDGILLEAVRQLNGEGLSRLEAEAQRETLIQGYRWMLVDEYQDIGPEEYALISAIAGRSLADRDARLSLFAVGDDDQNIYAFTGASIRFIRQFETDYGARPEYLVENYRSTAHIIAAGNAVIAPAADRMKARHDIRIDRRRGKDPAGGDLASLDPVGQGRVQVLDAAPGDVDQAVAAVDELVRLSHLDPEWSWTRTAIIARDWRRLAPVRAYAETLGIPVEMANESLPSIWRLREMQRFVDALRSDAGRLLGVRDLIDVLNTIPSSRWTELVAEGIAALARELASKTMPVPDLIEWFAEWAQDARGDQRGLLLSTAHRSKGLEFDDVVILNGGWDRASQGEDPDAPRRLFYVAMTRARRSLTILAAGPHPLVPAGGDHMLRRATPPAAAGSVRSTALYQVPNLRVVDLSWAGRLRPGHASLGAIGEAKAGDPLRIVAEGDAWMMRDAQGRALGRMARSWSPPDGLAIRRAEIGAIMRRRRADSTEEFRPHLQRDVWEAVLPEIVFDR
ncbi:RecQ family ATP-dependent DNA helicase [Aquibium microcysteis]|uniref:RecQ family ATP-dependent DNA helicase n=1 Tax=Aquibium microcysteis TaxID=675281 RepID=UPI00165D0104|nr:RecQ family ATP-dependent DNA helicase [Aquibium microcysteis]